jgi:hypothetical protein
MKVGQLISLLALCDANMPVTVLAVRTAERADTRELPFAQPTLTIEGGGAAPAYYALNVVLA